MYPFLHILSMSHFDVAVSYNTTHTHLDVPLDAALNHTLGCRRILLEQDLAVLDERVRLYEDLARLVITQRKHLGMKG